MAKLTGKDIKDLSTWDMKELRKLRMAINNRVESIQKNPKPEELKKGHPLHGKGLEDCQALLEKVKKAERDLAKG